MYPVAMWLFLKQLMICQLKYLVNIQELQASYNDTACIIDLINTLSSEYMLAFICLIFAC